MRKPVETDSCWLDGERVAVDRARVSIGDPAIQAGLGLFETLALRDGRVLELERHLARLLEGAGRLGLDVPRREVLLATARKAARDDAPAYGWLKIVVTGGGRWVVFRGAMERDEEGRSVSAVTLPWRRNPSDPLAGLKTLNYAGNLLGLEWARERGADEGLWLNTRGHLAEGCSSNLFLMRGRRLFTPAVRDGILPGVVRELVLAAARRLGCPVHEGKLRVPLLGRADEAFLTSSLRGLRPLLAVDGRAVGNGQPGAWTGRLAADVAHQRQKAAEIPVGAPQGPAA